MRTPTTQTARHASAVRVAVMASALTLALLAGMAPGVVDPDPLSRTPRALSDGAGGRLADADSELEARSGEKPVPGGPEEAPVARPSLRHLLVEVEELAGQGVTRILLGPNDLALPPGRPLWGLPGPRRWPPHSVQALFGCEGDAVEAALVMFDCRLGLAVEYASSGGRASHVTWWEFLSGAADVPGARPGDRLEFASFEPLAGLTPGECSQAADGVSCRRLHSFALARLTILAFRKTEALLTAGP